MIRRTVRHLRAARERSRAPMIIFWVSAALIAAVSLSVVPIV